MPMEEKRLAIRLRGVKKKYRLGVISGRTFLEDAVAGFARLRGRTSPENRKTEREQGKEFPALDGIDLDLYEGEAVGIIGENGAGKSTLLKLISQITAPTEGEIDLYGRITSMLEVGIGFTGEMTGRENIYLNGAILGMKKREIDRVIDKIIEFSEVGEFIDTPVKRYSSGMYVKLAFAVASHLDSEIMIMDEVLAVGDMAFQNKCLERMREVASKEGRTILYVSHNMNTIRKLCSRCIVLEKGRMIYDGDVEQAIALYMNHAAGELSTDTDLLMRPRAADSLGKQAALAHLQLPEKAVPCYRAGEALNLLITIEAKQPLSGVSLRATIRNSLDEGIGTGWSEPMDFPEAGRYVRLFTIHPETMGGGIFYLSLGLNRQDDTGDYYAIDHITRVLKLELEPPAHWDPEAYGLLRLKVTDDEAIAR